MQTSAHTELPTAWAPSRSNEIDKQPKEKTGKTGSCLKTEKQQHLCLKLTHSAEQHHSKHKKARIYTGLAAFYAIRCLAVPDAGSFPLYYK
ncbi:hypothetical protein D3M96_09145 [Alcaligenes aquatilis]|uniref:Uncharacterized protein n=1 Tax=Alcaligenes aquatilis TaxID=323284 RepID=A0A3G2HUE7_9BURK|nr:hypothetical protein D3M96_09145 [Alcaligenes aquatilis]